MLQPSTIFFIYSALIELCEFRRLVLLNEYSADDLATVLEDGNNFFLGSKCDKESDTPRATGTMVNNIFRNRIIVICAETFRLKTIVPLHATTTAVAECLMKGFGKKRNLSEECEASMSAVGISTFNKNCPAYHLSYRNYTFTALSVDISCQKQTLLRALPQRKRLWIPVNDDRWFREPTFIALFGWKHYVYIVFNEKSDHGVEGRIGSICADDPGVADNVVPYKNTFNSFGKLLFTCPLGTNNLHLKILRTAQIYTNFVFATFWNDFQKLPISALCVFDINKIEEKLLDDKIAEMARKMENHCPKRNQSGIPTISDKTATAADPRAYYVFPEMTEIVAVNVVNLKNGNYQIIAISKQAKVYGLVFNGTFIDKKWTDRINAEGEILELRSRRKTFTILSSNFFKEYKVNDWSSRNAENISQNIRWQSKYGWTEWSSCSQRCGGGYRSREWRCLTDQTCNSSIENQQQYQLCNSVTCSEVRRYSAWSHWLSLGKSTEIRYRASCGVELPDPLLIKSTLHASKRVLTYEWLAWSEWTACSATCGNSLRSRWRAKKGFILSYNESVQYFMEPCLIPPCEFDNMIKWTSGSDVRWRNTVKYVALDGCIYKLNTSDSFSF
uniref:Sema domain-containing protein n=1 Tax=Setaria digitata TaxID=48799 RepID=A0A915Q7Z0_9BILA